MKNQKTDKCDFVFLRGKKTALRPILESDIPHLMRWVNDPDIRSFITSIFPSGEIREREWLQDLARKHELEIVLTIEAGGKPIGTMGIHGINWKDRTATTGALIGEKSYWGKGYGTDAKMALLDYAFNSLGLRKIMSRVCEFNKRSLAYSLHCGYQVEGRLRRQHFVNGRYWDEIILGLFKSQWLPHWEKHMNK